MKTKLIISVLAFLAITTVAGAQNKVAPSRNGNCSGKGIAYVDANKNGICDNYENSATATNPYKRRGNGRCCVMGQGQRGMGQGQGKGRRINSVDADQNRICDYYEARVKK